jgi:sarcosine oxidase delta subunit
MPSKFCPECGKLNERQLNFLADVKLDRKRKPKRKLSAWNKFVKANSNKKIYKFANGKLKLKKMGIAFRKTRAGRKK